MDTPNTAPLAGIKILDLSRLLPGPLGAQYLADLGADVIKIEDTQAGDYAPPALRAVCNRNKRGICLDLKHPDGQAALAALARDADVVIESFRPGVTARLKADYATLSRHNPRLVYCSITGYGQDGPQRDAAGHDLNYSGYAGVADQMGCGPDQPALSNLPVADILGGSLTAVMGILAALVDAQRTGRGRYVDIAIADGLLAGAVVPLATLNAHGDTRPAGADSLSGGLACYGQYRTQDGRYLAVAALEPKFWNTLCQRLQRPDLLPQHRDGDATQQAQVRGELQRIFSEQPLAYWLALLGGADCCVSPVLKLAEALAHPHFSARGMVQHTRHEVYGPGAHVASPVKMSGFQFAIHRQAPLPGEHTDQILRDAGYTESGIASLTKRGIAR
ncbi:CaiB/BaiF CoA-transferase family protein [Achromobacter seleniivolatilans]|uniref:CaiB/BaiF CoA-transferase family protein n=1 Tax=Achromobacter seleniivolatilans TaxID=3047478 RepID=A0ABY9M195_9BURK|nr:CaiB/BaiF CoA-transferase family protein [Achromobacter sp. R39]WMD20776.1 CaiB/BaiF CoA-transferase family protein [Achromobacter sp. R39]